ncbi:hypothetical protein HYS95_01605 [Candidatus Daviesbacteria bacterium]|nr:hypothetical protein [Candidatus Daviesbacteria bacterium]
MELFLKKTQTLIGSLILIILFFISPNITRSQEVFAAYDPLSVPNNKFGIHIIQATPDESSPAAQLVNNNGDWGYITVLVESKDRNHEKWQEFFNDLRRRHLIPLVRLATQPESGGFWKRPYEGEAQAWADFLDRLNWPTKNRYIIVYNEPNHATEWGNKVDASDYAKTLDQLITMLKNKNQDFFVLNAGLDASAPNQLPRYLDVLSFMQQMEQAVPGILQKLDGWVSHSYPNPAFAGSPYASGKGTVRSWYWELQQLRNLGVSKNLPVFITETGWKHAEGLNYDPSLPDEDTVAQYYKTAFENAWNSGRIVAVTPFLLSYQEIPFDHFSFKKPTGQKQNQKILGLEYPEYYSMYQVLRDLPKTSGKPIQDNKAKLIKGEIYSSIVSGQNYPLSFTLENTGQSIWNDPLSSDQVRLVATQGAQELGIIPATLPKDTKVEPNQQYTFNLDLKAPQSGTFKVVLNLLNGGKQFDSQSLEFTTVVKSPVVLKIKGGLQWKEDFSGNYILSIKGATGETIQNIVLNKEGMSGETEARYLLPDYAFDFTLEKPYYYPTQIRQTVYAGENILDFGDLKPNFFSAILNPKELWKISPFSK